MAITQINLTDPVSTLVTKTNSIATLVGDGDSLPSQDLDVIASTVRLTTEIGDFDSWSSSYIDIVQAINDIASNRLTDLDDSAEIVEVVRNSLSASTTTDGLTFTYDSATGAFSLTGTPAILAAANGGGDDKVFWLNQKTVTTSYTIDSTYNAMTAGPITIQNGATITVSNNSTLTIV